MVSRKRTALLTASLAYKYAFFDPRIYTCMAIFDKQGSWCSFVAPTYTHSYGNLAVH